MSNQTNRSMSYNCIEKMKRDATFLHIKRQTRRLYSPEHHCWKWISFVWFRRAERSEPHIETFMCASLQSLTSFPSFHIHKTYKKFRLHGPRGWMWLLLPNETSISILFWQKGDPLPHLLLWAFNYSNLKSIKHNSQMLRTIALNETREQPRANMFMIFICG